MDFRGIADERRRVKELCRKHVRSIVECKLTKGPSFKLFWDEPDRSRRDEVTHLTTSATCIESLIDCHPIFRPKGALNAIRDAVSLRADVADSDVVLKKLIQDFCDASLNREWVSEDSGPIYCSTRTLPLVLSHTDGLCMKHRRLIGRVYKQLREERTPRFAIGEENLGRKERDPKWYPENAYHTYWALKVLAILKDKFLHEVSRASGLTDPERTEKQMLLWARAKLAEEITLHWAGSAELDSDQLTWSLTVFIKFGGDLSSDLRGQDLVRKAFEALGGTQEPVGTWRHYRPLFVYSNVGNAYCYVFESFAFLLNAVIARFEEQEFLEDVLRGFLPRLTRLRMYAEMTQVQGSDGAVGWSSGHRPGEGRPEGWATASVFSFLQVYRRVLGVLARRDALRALPRPPVSKTEDAVSQIEDRGDTWVRPGETPGVAEDLITLFVNPVRAGGKPDWSEPDAPPIGEDQARSAILFGPPGSSKTNLARTVAAAVDWKYVELHSSHFVSEGVDAIQRTADKLFAYLMELDHAVVLFDEPDELVREREDAPDAFNRFLTTSMLPKLAELWKQRRIVYFVATNHIRYFDAAITRAERFDVLVCVTQPSYSKKSRELQEKVRRLTQRTVLFTVTHAEIQSALDGLESLSWRRPPDELPASAALAKFALLRWDQIDELAFRIVKLPADTPGTLNIDSLQLSRALANVADRRLCSVRVYLDYLTDLKYGRRDFQRQPVFSVRKFVLSKRYPATGLITAQGQQLWRPLHAANPMALPGYQVVRTGKPGEVDIFPA